MAPEFRLGLWLGPEWALSRARQLGTHPVFALCFRLRHRSRTLKMKACRKMPKVTEDTPQAGCATGPGGNQSRKRNMYGETM
jgi:hypothetical protein